MNGLTSNVKKMKKRSPFNFQLSFWFLTAYHEADGHWWIDGPDGLGMAVRVRFIQFV